MNLTSPTQVRDLLRRLDVRPSTALGQNFLVDRNILDVLVAEAGLHSGDHVLEIGPGLGVVTVRLLDCGCRVRAVEKDKRLVRYLEEQFGEGQDVELIEGDALRVGLDTLLAGGVTRLVSNLPYSSGTRFLMRLFEANRSPDRMVVTVQREMADRMAAQPHSSAYGTVSVWTQALFEVSLLRTVSGNCFWPRPDVESAIVRLDRRCDPPDAETLSAVQRLSRYAFMHRRKQLAGILNAAPNPIRTERKDAAEAIASLGLDRRVRPEALAVDDWILLAARLRAGPCQECP